MPFDRSNRLARYLLGVIAAIGTLSLACVVQAGEKPLSSGIMIAGNSLIARTTCLIFNIGTKPVTISSAAVFVGPEGQNVPPDSDSCLPAPLSPNTACGFNGGSGGVYGGGNAFVKKGSLKNLRGACRLTSDSGVVVQILPMQ